jgi:hypothetical protein
LAALEDFFGEIDSQWPERPARKIQLSIIGCGALMLQVNYERGTKDSDVFETTSLTREIQRDLLVLAGKDTPLHIRRKMYIDIVANGVPFLPRPALWRPIEEVNRSLANFEIHALDVVDVVVSKLKRFSANDISDIDEMIQRDLVPHERLVERFRSAYDEFTYDARAADLPKIVERLHQVERDMIGADETEFDLDRLRY